MARKSTLPFPSPLSVRLTILHHAPAFELDGRLMFVVSTTSQPAVITAWIPVLGRTVSIIGSGTLVILSRPSITMLIMSSTWP